MLNLLIYARAVHYAATIMAAGIAFFAVCIAEPAFRKSSGDLLVTTLRRRFAWIGWISLALCVLSGASWFVLTATSMSGQALAQIYTNDVLWTVLTQTDFGNDWLARLVLVCVSPAHSFRSSQRMVPRRRGSRRPRWFSRQRSLDH